MKEILQLFDMLIVIVVMIIVLVNDNFDEHMDQDLIDKPKKEIKLKYNII